MRVPRTSFERFLYSLDGRVEQTCGQARPGFRAGFNVNKVNSSRAGHSVGRGGLCPVERRSESLPLTRRSHAKRTSFRVMTDYAEGPRQGVRTRRSGGWGAGTSSSAALSRVTATRGKSAVTRHTGVAPNRIAGSLLNYTRRPITE